jgi:hypothetical protein
MLRALLRLLGVNLNQKVAEIRAQIGELKAEAVSQVVGQVKKAGLTAGFVLVGAFAALLTFMVALAALYLWIDILQGPFAALAAVGLVTLLLAALMFTLAFRRGKPAPAPSYVKPAASPSAPVLLSATLPPPPPGASVLDVLAHRFSTRAAAAGDEAIDAAVHAMRTSPRSALFGALAVVALVGVMIGRRR